MVSSKVHTTKQKGENNMMDSRYFKDCKTAEDVKRRYKELACKLHPDNNPDHDSTREFQDMQAEFTAVFERLKTVHVNAAGEEYTKDTTETAADYMDIIEQLISISGVVVEVCGSWIWVTGDTKPAKDRLKRLNFKFSGKKQAWYYHRDPYRKHRKGSMTLDEIRGYYGSTKYTGDHDPDKLE